jgi:catechol 2,3-dioxygenase-like lactoylglutathione lyase family enzyme
MSISIQFYRDCLGLKTQASINDGWAIFETFGTRLALFPINELSKDAGTKESPPIAFHGFTLAHNVSRKSEVDDILNSVVQHGGKITSPAHDRIWGVYSGYFSDPDGYHWEIAYGDEWEFDSNWQLWGGPLGPPRAKLLR